MAGEVKYPGELASPEEMRELAEEYRKAAHELLKLGQPGKPLTRSPFRLSAIHAIELYLNAFLLRHGHPADQIRRMQHNLLDRAKVAHAKGLSLRTRTMSHLESLTDSREYLVTRYSPELAGTTSQVNRLVATLDEVAEKVSVRILQSPKP